VHSVKKPANEPNRTAAIASVTHALGPGQHDTPFWQGNPDSESFTKIQKDRLASAQQTLDRLLAVKGKRTIENTLKLYDEILTYLDAASAQASLMEQVHPDALLRTAAEKITQDVSGFATELSLNRTVYDALASLDAGKADPITRYFLERTLRDFRLAGVDKDDATRKKIRVLRDELVTIGQEFSRNIREDKRSIVARDASELDGLPADFVARHKPNTDGTITLTIDYPDAIPVFSYAKSEDLRKRMYMEYNNRAHPANMAVLDRLIAKRHELASILGFKNWADYVTADKMVGTGKKASEFVEKIAIASKEKASRDYQTLLKWKKIDFAETDRVNAWESSYWTEIVRKSEYSFDAQSVRPYFGYDRVKQGVFDVTSRLFDVEFKKNDDAPVWHPSVECYEMFENGTLVGRFYLDMHPRENKFNHAAEFTVQSGIERVQIPEAALICNFPGGIAGDPGLMEHSDVMTFFHEFGHLLHHLFGGRQKWVGVSGIQTEWDFVEAPSQMLEEWAWDPATLATFARNYQTNEPIPAELVKKMRQASEFGKGIQVRTQMSYARLSLSCYDRSPALVDTDALTKSVLETYCPFKFVEGTHFQCSFGHLVDYSAVYYTYMWALVIAKDLFSQFDRKDLLATGAAKRYRDTILAPGGSKPAARLVKDFLGRDFSFEPWQRWLNESD
jgi:thimet oligopeptidase